MHYLHSILVYIPDAITVNHNTTKEDIFAAVKNYAEDETERFCNQVFSWRETNSAGSWESEYPQQVYIASDDLTWFISRLENIRIFQNYEIDTDFSRISNDIGTDLGCIIQVLQNRDVLYDSTANYLQGIGELLNGTYRFNSCFFDIHRYTARIYSKTIEEICKSPKDWALVMFDYHS